MCVCVCVCIYMYIYVCIYIRIYYLIKYVYVSARSSSFLTSRTSVTCIMLYAQQYVYRCNEQASNVILSIQFYTNVSQLVRRVSLFFCNHPCSFKSINSHHTHPRVTFLCHVEKCGGVTIEVSVMPTVNCHKRRWEHA